MATLTIRVDEDDKKLFQEFAKSKGSNLSDWARETLLQSIEDEYDLSLVREYLEEKDSLKFYTLDEVSKELGL